MLSMEDNELLCRVGPGTPMGALLRRFWTPFLESFRLPEPDGAPVEVRLLGEDLLAFRDTNGRAGLLGAQCPHRRAPLFYGRNEESGLRCVYHGWKFDVDGNCVDMPVEPAESNFKDKVKALSYPVAERGGVLWAYMGPRHLQPELPNFEWTRVRESQRLVGRYRHYCNWFQSIEGDVDSSHIGFLHWNARRQANAPDMEYQMFDKAPSWLVQPTDYGMVLAARRNTPEGDRYYWRINHWLVPYYTMVATDLALRRVLTHIWVPIDDYQTDVWDIRWATGEDITGSERDAWFGGPDPHIASLDFSTARLMATMQNHYNIDRDAQRTWSFTGISGVREQDAAMVEGMGAIVDRSAEHLGTSDQAVIALRRLCLKYVRRLQEGEEPVAASEGEQYNIRPWSAFLTKDLPLDQDPKAKELMRSRV